ncbi:helix-turn-helix domain-containing protein [Hymenobacter bucti]|uniref:Helix-turn-helix domain-containing protein n=1 Tax=Hymenobacter bucti TaxID=1844114 RepID=A0ABW4R2X8_9BACT
MSRESPIPVHGMKEPFSNIYLAPLGAEKTGRPAYEVSQAHRHDYYYCVLLEQGDAAFEVDFQPVQLTDQSLFLSYPGQLHRLVSARLERGWYLAFAPTLLDEPLRDILEQCLSEVVLLPLVPAQSARFCALLQQAYPIYADTNQLFRQSILQALVRAFLYQVAAAYLAGEKLALGTHSARQLELTKAVKQLLRQPATALRRPAELAATLCVSASYLNDTIRAVTGFSVTYHLQQAVMREAQRLLVTPELSVNEVAYQLQFDDAKYFNRLFRKVVGTSPGAFRKRGEMAR